MPRKSSENDLRQSVGFHCRSQPLYSILYAKFNRHLSQSSRHECTMFAWREIFLRNREKVRTTTWTSLVNSNNCSRCISRTTGNHNKQWHLFDHLILIFSVPISMSFRLKPSHVARKIFAESLGRRKSQTRSEKMFRI